MENARFPVELAADSTPHKTRERSMEYGSVRSRSHRLRVVHLHRTSGSVPSDSAGNSEAGAGAADPEARDGSTTFRSSTVQDSVSARHRDVSSRPTTKLLRASAVWTTRRRPLPTTPLVSRAAAPASPEGRGAMGTFSVRTAHPLPLRSPYRTATPLRLRPARYLYRLRTARPVPVMSEVEPHSSPCARLRRAL